MKIQTQWVATGVLALACATLAVVQYRWTGELSVAELQQSRQRAAEQLRATAAEFNTHVTRAVSALTPDDREVQESGIDAAYSARLSPWRADSDPMFSRIALATPDSGGEITLWFAGADRFARADWPAEWSAVRQMMRSRMGQGIAPEGAEAPWVFEVPHFSVPRPGAPLREREWLVLELDRNWVSGTLLPELLARNLGDQWDAALFSGGRGRSLLWESTKGAGGVVSQAPDAEDDILAIVMNTGRGRGRGPDPPPGFNRGGRGRGPDRGGPGRLRLAIRHREGSLAAVVARTRQRNLAVSFSVLLLILATSALLLRAARTQSALAEMQMNFVAGVSHELRTPLTVIRTAAYNLRSGVASRPEQVERYGKLIHDESGRLMGMVEQVLALARRKAAPSARREVTVGELIRQAVSSSLAGAEPPPCRVEISPADNLPTLTCDPDAVTQALRNLLDNAVKYASSGGWIGVRAALAGQKIEVTVSDRGPGVPEVEKASIFHDFFRGRDALGAQIHGAGLGLSLTRRIAEDQGGSVRVSDHPGGGAEFTLSLPLHPKGNDGANSAG